MRRILKSAVAVLSLMSLGAVEAEAQSRKLTQPGSGLFKVVKPPARGARKRITINNVSEALPPSRRGRAQRHAWFWRVASPRLDAADPARGAALAATAARKIAGPRSVVDKIVADFGAEITSAAGRANVSEPLLIALVAAESAGKARAVSSKGAQGLGQLMPATAKRFDVSDPFDPAENLRGSADYLSFLLKEFRGDMLLALAGYNAGEGAVRRNSGVPPFNETRDYVPIVLSYYHTARALCERPPLDPRARCTFKQ